MVGDVTDRSLTAGVCDGVDAVISALGVTRQKADPWDIDYRANLNILESARAHDVTRFCYVNAIHAESIRSQLTRAKTAFAQALIQSPLAHQVVSPSGYFSDMSAIAQMARRGCIFCDRKGGLTPFTGRMLPHTVLIRWNLLKKDPTILVVPRFSRGAR